MAVRFNHVDTALLQEANNWVEKEWQEGPRSAWHLNCLVYSVAMTVRGKTTNESQPCNQGRKLDNQKSSKNREVTRVTGRPKTLGLEDCLPGWMWK